LLWLDETLVSVLRHYGPLAKGGDYVAKRTPTLQCRRSSATMHYTLSNRLRPPRPAFLTPSERLSRTMQQNANGCASGQWLPGGDLFGLMGFLHWQADRIASRRWYESLRWLVCRRQASRVGGRGKAPVVAAVRHDLIRIKGACRRHEVSEEKFFILAARSRPQSVDGLRVSCLQRYRGNRSFRLAGKSHRLLRLPPGKRPASRARAELQELSVSELLRAAQEIDHFKRFHELI